VQSNDYKVWVNINQPRGFYNELIDGDLTGSADEITPHGTDVSHQFLNGKLTATPSRSMSTGRTAR
jgi:hypothetical protein